MLTVVSMRASITFAAGQSSEMVLLQLLIPLITWSVVNVTVDINDSRFISLDTILVSREEVCLPSF